MAVNHRTSRKQVFKYFRWKKSPLKSFPVHAVAKATQKNKKQTSLIGGYLCNDAERQTQAFTCNWEKIDCQKEDRQKYTLLQSVHNCNRQMRKITIHVTRNEVTSSIEFGSTTRLYVIRSQI
ncbi:hypothetical protein ACHWQZ_G016210 [Mnemiopsis leidyi]